MCIIKYENVPATHLYLTLELPIVINIYLHPITSIHYSSICIISMLFFTHFARCWPVQKPWKVACGRQALEGDLWQTSLGRWPVVDKPCWATFKQFLVCSQWAIVGKWPVDNLGKVACR